MTDLTFAFLLTLLAGLSTSVGGLIVLISKKTDLKFMSIGLGFAAGVMVYISFTDIFFKAMEALQNHFEHYMFVVTIAFFGGIALMALIDRLLPDYDSIDPFMLNMEPSEKLEGSDEKQLKRTGLMTAISVALHNLPEGLVVFMAAFYDPAAGIAVAIGIAIHNIPEGIAIASPIFYGTGSKSKAFLAAFASGMTEPLGALIGYFVLLSIFTYAVEGISFALVGGIMVYIAFDKLLPTSQKFSKHSTAMVSLFAGMAVMAASIVLLT